MNKENAITLVALIVSIIVLLILATVSISLVINNGILDKSKSAVDRYSEGEIEEQIKLAYIELQTEKLYNSNVDDSDFLTNSLKQTFGNDNVRNVSVTNRKVGVDIKTKVDFVRYLYNVETGIAKVVQDWKQEADGSYSNGSTKGVQVGDIVKYESKLAKTANAVDSSKKAQLISDLVTYSGNTDSSENTDSSVVRDNLTWKVLDVKDGKIRLISAVPTTSKIRLYNANGYNNAVYLLDKACDTLYSIDGVGKSKNLKIEDIEEKLKSVNEKTARDNYTNTNVTPNLKYGNEKEYKSNLKYPNIYQSEVGCKALTTADNNGNTLGLSEQTSPVTGSSTAANRLKVTQTYWYGTMSNTDFKDSKYYTIFMNNGANLPTYWLSSRDVSCASNAATFNVRYVSDGNIGSFFMFFSNGDPSGPSCSFRPVITLNKEVTLSGNSTDGWTIQ